MKKVKKKDDKSLEYPEWELTSAIAVASFKACLGPKHFVFDGFQLKQVDPSVPFSELPLTYGALGNWVFPPPPPPIVLTKKEIEAKNERTKEEVKRVRWMLARALDVPDAFKLYMKEIDKDKSGTISAQEFVKLLMVRLKKIYLAST